ncbi:helix-turn-helix domain-containing protein [Candidatus Poriferisodalis sp.]|uniref:helix-turn-helix domain-containing protein n=1 Tax=Candidatus Poriferisodalis sp. TaxID=3101277 RepID=UPI003B019B94
MNNDTPPKEEAEEIMTPDEVARFLKVSKKTVLRRARLGELPAAKVGRAWRFRRSELLAYLTPEST